MIVPNIPLDPLVDIKTGNINPSWGLFFNQLINQLQNNYSQEGTIIPSATSSQITQLETATPIARIIYNTTLSRMMLSNTGTYQLIDVT